MKLSTTVLIGSMLALLSLGMLTLYSLSPLHDSLRYLSRQLVAAGLGLTGALVLGRIHYRRLQSWSWLLLALAVGLLVLVLVFGVKVNGARRWFRIGTVQFQPSDFAKLALLVALAHYGAAHQRLMRTFWYGIAVPGMLMGLVVGLVFFEPDWGTALLLGASGLVVLLVAGAHGRYLLPPVLLGLVAFSILLALDPLRIDRVHAWLHPEATRQGVGYRWTDRRRPQRQHPEELPARTPDRLHLRHHRRGVRVRRLGGRDRPLPPFLPQRCQHCASDS
jgi:cell division protein FtsW